jgi:hypothetical protein
MKKITYLIFVSLLSFNISAQTSAGDSRFGFVAGVNASYLNGDDGEDYVDDLDDAIDYLDDQQGVDAEGGIKPRIGMNIGFTYDNFVADNIALNTGFIYSMKGFVAKQEVKGNQTYNNYTYNTVDIESKIAVQLDYIDIPIGLKYATDEGFEITGGLVLSILANDKIDYDVDDISYYAYNNNDEPEDFEDLYDEDPEKTIIGLNIGVGYTFNEKFNVSFKLQQGGELGEIGNEDENKNLILQLSAGVYF